MQEAFPFGWGVMVKRFNWIHPHPNPPPSEGEGILAYPCKPVGGGGDFFTYPVNPSREKELLPSKGKRYLGCIASSCLQLILKPIALH